MSVSMTLWPITVGKLEIMMEIESTRSLKATPSKPQTDTQKEDQREDSHIALHP